jgi:hypothetical protein
MNTVEIAIPIEIAFADAPDGVSIVRSENNYIEFAETGRNWPVYVITAVSTLSLGVLSNYLYDTMKSHMHEKPKTIMIEHEDVRFERGEIERVLRDKITITE